MDSLSPWGELPPVPQYQTLEGRIPAGPGREGFKAISAALNDLGRAVQLGNHRRLIEELSSKLGQLGPGSLMDIAAVALEHAELCTALSVYLTCLEQTYHWPREVELTTPATLHDHKIVIQVFHVPELRAMLDDFMLTDETFASGAQQRPFSQEQMTLAALAMARGMFEEATVAKAAGTWPLDRPKQDRVNLLNRTARGDIWDQGDYASRGCHKEMGRLHEMVRTNGTQRRCQEIFEDAGGISRLQRMPALLARLGDSPASSLAMCEALADLQLAVACANEELFSMLIDEVIWGHTFAKWSKACGVCDIGSSGVSALVEGLASAPSLRAHIAKGGARYPLAQAWNGFQHILRNMYDIHRKKAMRIILALRAGRGKTSSGVQNAASPEAHLSATLYQAISIRFGPNERDLDIDAYAWSSPLLFGPSGRVEAARARFVFSTPLAVSPGDTICVSVPLSGGDGQILERVQWHERIYSIYPAIPLPELPVAEVMEMVSRHPERSDERHKPDTRLLMNDTRNLGSELESKLPKKSSHKRTFPWAGFVSLVAIVLLTFAALGLLLFSNATLVDSWRVNGIRIQPQVWVSVLTTLMDGLTACALVDGASINFWRKTSKGATLQNLYDIHESQAFVGAAKTLLRLRPNKVAITALLCLASTLRGPLFQRASVVKSNHVTERVQNHELRVAQLIPPGYLFPDVQDTTTRFDAVLDQYTERIPAYINITGSECEGSCTGKVKGYGFDIKCSNSTIAWSSSNNSTVIELYRGEGNGISGAVPSFNTSAHLQGYVGPDDDESSRPSFDSAEERGWLDAVSLFKTEPICGGELSITNCSLHHAVLEYAVEIRNYTIRLQHPHWQDDTVLFQTPTWNSEEFSQGRWGSTTFWLVLYMLLFNQEIDIKENGHGFVSDGDVRLLLVKRFVNGDFNSINCSTTFRDPTQYILDRMRELAFRAAVAAANNVSDTKMLFGLPSLIADGLPLIQNWTQTVELTEQNISVIFIVSTPYLIAAVVASLLAVVAISPLYWGWKELQFPPSFNPVVVANAFDAPDFKDIDVRQIGKRVRNGHGLRRVRFPPQDNKTEGLALR